MTISFNWLKNYVDIPLSVTETCELLTDLGLEVEGVEKHRSTPLDLSGIVIGEVVTCERHPEADRLSITNVQMGAPDLLQIVCGAPNVAAGQRVVVATIGAQVLDREGQMFTIKRGKIRGAESQGMICAIDELGLGSDHSGIMVLPTDAPVGTLYRDFITVEEDYIIEIGLTPNRSDATNHVGVARDLAAALRVRHGKSGEICLPLVDAFKEGSGLDIKVEVENTDACPRYSGVCISGVTIAQSPEWLQKRLAAVGVRAINNVVDVTNFVLHELGQPLHAFDYDKIGNAYVVVKNLPEGTKFITLDETERNLHHEDLMICDGNSKGMCIGGVFGGIGTGVSDSTVNIFLESACFSARSIRRTATRHGLRTDAARTFEKGTDPNIAVYALKRAALLIQELAGGSIASPLIDIYPKEIERPRVKVQYHRIERLIGCEISEAEIKNILAALDMTIEEETSRSLTLRIPTNKVDVLREEDVIEEIVRVYGMNNVPMPSQMRLALVQGEAFNKQAVQRSIADMLASNGLCEMMAVSLSQSGYYADDLLGIDAENLVRVNNTANMHLDIMRPSMLPSGLEAIAHNLNRQQTEVRLYEFGKTYRQLPTEDDNSSVDARYKETSHLSIFLTGKAQPEHWTNKSNSNVSFFDLKAQVLAVLSRLGIKNYQEEQVQGLPFASALRFFRGAQTLVTFGKVSPRIARKFDVKQEVWYADFNWDAVLSAASGSKTAYAEVSKFPSVRRDLALVLDRVTTFADIAKAVNKAGKPLLRDIRLFDVYEDESKLGEGKKSYAIALTLEDAQRTLQDKDVDAVMSKIESSLAAQLGATVRR